MIEGRLVRSKGEGGVFMGWLEGVGGQLLQIEAPPGYMPSLTTLIMFLPSSAQSGQPPTNDTFQCIFCMEIVSGINLLNLTFKSFVNPHTIIHHK